MATDTFTSTVDDAARYDQAHAYLDYDLPDLDDAAPVEPERCPDDECGPHGEHDGPCMAVVEIDGIEQRCPCNVCPACKGFGVQVVADQWRGGVRERTCPACSGLGQA